MTFTLLKHWQTGTMRHFTFEGDRHGKAGESMQVTVDVDMEMLRKHGIGIQELPLVCRRLLESLPAPVTTGGQVSFTEERMNAIRAAAFDANQLKEQARRKSFR